MSTSMLTLLKNQWSTAESLADYVLYYDATSKS